jgi:hemerythrin-like metal-binding domain
MPWTKNLAVGVELIDNEHIKLFEMADELFEAGRNHKAAEFIGELFGFLDDYTKKHFGDEEKLMLKIGYPDYPLQKKLHDEFIAKLGAMRKEYNQSGGNVALVISANQLILDWLVKHISVLDKKIGDYVREKKLQV